MSRTLGARCIPASTTGWVLCESSHRTCRPAHLGPIPAQPFHRGGGPISPSRVNVASSFRCAAEYRRNKSPFYASSTDHPRVTKRPEPCHCRESCVIAHSLPTSLSPSPLPYPQGAFSSAFGGIHLVCGYPGRRPAGAGVSFSCRSASIFSITTGSSMQAMILTAPPHSRQVSISILNTRLRRCAQLIDARRSAGVSSPCPAWPGSPKHGVYCWGQTHRESVSG